MSLIYKRHCNYCGGYYEGQGEYYCSTKCRARAVNPASKRAGHKYYATCLTCGIRFFYQPSRSSGYFCSRDCYNKSEMLKTHVKRGGRIVANRYHQKLTDEKILAIWEEIKSNPSLSVYHAFSLYGYKRVPPKRLISLIGRAEYDSVMQKRCTPLQRILGRRNAAKGRRGEGSVLKKLKKDGFTAFRSAGSHSPFDIFAMNKNEVKIIQVKNWKRDYLLNMEKLKKELSDVPAPSFIKKEIWLVKKEKKGEFEVIAL